MSDSVWPHSWQPTRLPRPWDSPGKNTGVGCHFLLQCMKVKSESEVAQSCPTLSDPMDCGPPGSSVHGIFQARVLEWGAITTGPQGNLSYRFLTHAPFHFKVIVFLTVFIINSFWILSNAFSQSIDMFLSLFFFNIAYAYELSCFSHVQLFATPWTVALQVLLSMEFSRQEHWSGLPCPPPGVFPSKLTCSYYFCC